MGEFGTYYPPLSTHTHGDIVALVLAGKNVNDQILGIASNANLYLAAASYTTPGLIGNYTTLLAFHAFNKEGVKIVNNSYGSNYGDKQQRYIDYAERYLNSINATAKETS
ncbi:hypothetical protein BGI39_04235 [Snodgrassella communis]|nr:hypothetical protein BGI39_04235 [Snodgrassella communis]